jgi:poly-beta-1,6-N-acetyl-D-glucosamine N-deacetylase PgaB
MPILEKYGFPAVLSVVTGWVDGRQVPDKYQDRLLTWEQLRAVSRSPLVEILSHTDNLHHGILANPQGNLTPALITRRYDAARGSYETETDFRQRIRADLMRSKNRLRAELGKSPPGIAWPYGFYDQVLAEEATALGLRYHLTLAEEPARTEQFPRINRITLRATNTIAAFEEILSIERTHRSLRIIEIELDDMASRPAAEQEKWLSSLLSRLRLLRANTVVVNPFTRDGRHAFFQNDRVPLRAEVLHRVLHQIRTRARVSYLLLHIPVIPGVVPATMDLARRHPYDGVLLAAGHKPAEARALLRLFEYHHPGVHCGREQGATWPVCEDFMVVAVDSPTMSNRAAANINVKPMAPIAVSGSMPVYVLLQNRPDDDGAEVTKALHGLRTAGARHYGLRYGTFLDDPVNVRRVAVELAGHTIRGSRN